MMVPRQIKTERKYQKNIQYMYFVWYTQLCKGRTTGRLSQKEGVGLASPPAPRSPFIAVRMSNHYIIHPVDTESLRPALLKVGAGVAF